MAAQIPHHVSPNTELVAVGAANPSARLFQAFPVAGGFSRSALNFTAGTSYTDRHTDDCGGGR